MRVLRERAQFKPLRGSHRVFLIDRLDRANEQAANSLLKVLEEPPEHLVIFGDGGKFVRFAADDPFALAGCSNWVGWRMRRWRRLRSGGSCQTGKCWWRWRRDVREMAAKLDLEVFRARPRA